MCCAGVRAPGGESPARPLQPRHGHTTGPPRTYPHPYGCFSHHLYRSIEGFLVHHWFIERRSKLRCEARRKPLRHNDTQYRFKFIPGPFPCPLPPPLPPSHLPTILTSPFPAPLPHSPLSPPPSTMVWRNASPRPTPLPPHPPPPPLPSSLP